MAAGDVSGGINCHGEGKAMGERDRHEPSASTRSVLHIGDNGACPDKCEREGANKLRNAGAEQWVHDFQSFSK